MLKTVFGKNYSIILTKQLNIKYPKIGEIGLNMREMVWDVHWFIKRCLHES